MQHYVKKLSVILLSGLFTVAHAYNVQHVQQFEKTNKCNDCDLSGLSIGVGDNPASQNHSGAQLQQSNLSGLHTMMANFSQADLRGADLSGAWLESANLSYADLRGANLAGAHLINANLYGAIGVELSSAEYCDAILPDGKTVDCQSDQGKKH